MHFPEQIKEYACSNIDLPHRSSPYQHCANICLTEFEKELFEALTNEWVCTSVLLIRACILKGRKPLSNQNKNSKNSAISACNKLVLLGFAAASKTRGTIFWRLNDIDISHI